MKRIFLFLLFCLGLSVPMQAQIARDSIAADARYYTVRIDSILNVNTNTMKPDSLWQADPRKFSTEPVVQLQIDVAVTLGRTDTIVVKKRMIVALDSNRAQNDTLWVPVPLMKLSDATVDTLGVIARGPYGSQFGKSYVTESFLVYDAFMDGQPWRIERRSGYGHPVFPDNSCTHILYFSFHRRANYSRIGR